MLGKLKSVYFKDKKFRKGETLFVLTTSGNDRLGTEIDT
jgi:hypothetical protein